MKNDGLAITSMILGIVGIVLTFIPGLNFVGIVCGILAIVFGVMSKNKINNSNNEIFGLGMAKAGMILGIITIGIFIVTLVACGAILGSLT